VARKLIESHLRLVAKIARECCSRRELLPDLIQEGASVSCAPSRSSTRSGHSPLQLRILVDPGVRLPVHPGELADDAVATTFTQRKLFFNLNRESERLERVGQEVSAKNIAQSLGVTEKAVVEMRSRLGARDVSFETTLAVDPVSANHRLDGASGPERPDEEVEHRDLRSAVARRRQEIEQTLDQRDRIILDERMLADNPITLRQLGARFGVSRERARQLETRLKERLQPLFREFLGPTREGGDREELAA
jgi:RNA polymerase sigma-32 factor